MNKKVMTLVICVIVIIAVVLTVALVNGKRDNKSNGEETKNNEIILMTNGGVPYNWNYTIEDTSIVRCKDESSKDLNPDNVGGQVELHYIFEGLKEGTTSIKFEYKDFRDDTIEETKNYKVDVDSNLKVSISEKK